MSIPAFMEGLAGLSPSALSEGVRKLREPQPYNRLGCVSPQIQFAATSRIFPEGRGGGGGGGFGRKMLCHILRRRRTWGEAGISRGVRRKHLLTTPRHHTARLTGLLWLPFIQARLCPASGSSRIRA